MTATTGATRPPAPTADQPIVDLARLVGAVGGEVRFALDAMAWADDEISRAIGRNPRHADTFYHAFCLLSPRDLGPRMTERVYRSHAGELLARLATGGDTRLPTAAEICLACCEISQQVALHGPAAGMYLRAWARAFPNQPIVADQDGQLRSYERLHGQQIDALQAELRAKLRDPQRRLWAVECFGRHHGNLVACRYATATPRAPRRRAGA